MMNVVLSHNSAARYWVNHSGEAMPLPSNVLDNSEFESRIARIESNPVVSSWRESCARIHVLTPGHRSHRTLDGIVRHITSSVFAKGELLRLCSGTLVVSPAYCFLQMAAAMEFAELVRFGTTLCSSYYIANDTDARRIQQREPLTTRADISRLLDRHPGQPGVAQARRALRYICEGSGSPMETTISMLLVLPRKCGGYRFPVPALNQEIRLSPGARALCRKHLLRCDLFWKEPLVAMEYDSDAFHTGSERIAADAERRSALEYDGIMTLTVGRAQVMDPERFSSVAHALARKLGIRIRKGFEPDPGAVLQLRSLLLGANAWPSLND